MTSARELRTASHRVLREHIVHGHPVDPAALAGFTFRGTSLGLPRFVERLTWKTFQKTFWREPASGRLLGWNVRLEQDGLDAPSRPKVRRGEPVTEWHYEVVPPDGVILPPGFDRGLVIDYGRGADPPGIMHFLKDPLVALHPGNADELIGVTYGVLGSHALETPTYFTLEREGPIRYVPEGAYRARAFDPLRLSARERRWAEALFAAIIATDGSSGEPPPFDAIDRAAFWRTFDVAPAPLVRAGLRPMVHALTFLPLVSGYGKPFFRLAPDARARFLGEAARSSRYFVRQSLVTLKTLGCFAYFDDERVRAHYAANGPNARGEA